MPVKLSKATLFRLIETKAIDAVQLYTSHGAYLYKKNNKSVAHLGPYLTEFSAENEGEPFHHRYDENVLKLVDTATRKANRTAPSFMNGILVTAYPRYWIRNPYGLSIVFPLKFFSIMFNRFDITLLNQNRILKLFDEQRIYKRGMISRGEDTQTAQIQAKLAALDLIADQFHIGRKVVLNKFLTLRKNKLEALLDGKMMVVIPLNYLYKTEGKEVLEWLTSNIAPPFDPKKLENL